MFLHCKQCKSFTVQEKLSFYCHRKKCQVYRNMSSVCGSSILTVNLTYNILTADSNFNLTKEAFKFTVVR